MSTILERSVSASSDDCLYVQPGGYFELLGAEFSAGYNMAGYEAGGSAGRWLDISIPPGSTILSAKLRLVAVADCLQEVVNSRLRLERNVTPATFSDLANLLARTWTTAFVRWDAIPTWYDDGVYDSPDFAACLQEVIDLPGWASGNPVALLWDDDEERSTPVDWTVRSGDNFDAGTPTPPKIIISYEEAGGTRSKILLAGVGH